MSFFFSFIDQLVVMFGEELPPWDVDRKYYPQNLQVQIPIEVQEIISTLKCCDISFHNPVSIFCHYSLRCSTALPVLLTTTVLSKTLNVRPCF